MIKMKIEDFYNRYGTPEYWKSLEGLDLEELLTTHKPQTSHDQVIYDLLNRLYMNDLYLDKDRIYYNNYDYDLENPTPRNLKGHHEADLICIMNEKAYAFEVKTSNRYEGKARKQLDADYWFITNNYPKIKKIYKFYVSGHPNNYQIKRI